MNRQWKKRNGAKIRLAARRAKLIRDAIKESINVESVIEQWNAQNFQTMTPEQARDWARTNIRPDSEALMRAFRTLYAESYVLGEDIGMSAIMRAKVNKAPTLQQMRNASGINWDRWKPGNRAAAQLVKPSRGLSNLLDKRSITIQGLNQTSIDRIGTALARILERGDTPRDADISDIIDDPIRALTITQTEMSRAVTTASRQLYEDSGVELVEWLVAAPCDLCQENADVSPIGIGDTFPSGDTEPPAHPNCVCDIAPYVVDTQNIGEDALAYILDNE
jgi:hypothetical protein